ncbi:MAG: phosphoribosylamine--glycine ligase [Candidatus Caldatribacteriaceae bacterium]
MNVMVIGSGGREHCLAWKVRQNPLVKEIFCVPGNGGMAELGECVSLSSFSEIATFAREKLVDLVLVGPEMPLAMGIVDLLKAQNIPVVGPEKRAALLESSKVFAKKFMERCGIPTAPFQVFEHYEEAANSLRRRVDYPVVIKVDGLAGGKGVYILNDLDEALDALFEIMVNEKFGEAGKRVVIEDFVEGEEATVMLLVDGESYCFLPSSQDHKRVGEGDIGPNTGGMGAYSPTPLLSPSVWEKIERKIVHPLLEGIRTERLWYRGVLYLGLMVDRKGEPYVLEFNVRLGDPEAQVVLPRIQNDWVELSLALWRGELKKAALRVDERAALGVVLVSQGYPGHYEVGKRIKGLEEAIQEGDVFLFHAGTEKRVDGFYTTGGRVLNVCALGKDLKEAYYRVYEAIPKIYFEGMYYRRDIGFRVLKKQ